jgi:hypothetical protein
MQAHEFFGLLWNKYVEMAPTAGRIHELLEEQFGTVKNDHVAFRTFNLAPVSLSHLEPQLLAWGYTRHREYDFRQKHLRAFGYVPTRQDLPLIFMSELLTEELPWPCQDWIRDAMKDASSASLGEPLLLQGRPWAVPTWEQYQMLERASPYAAWLSVWGLCANHFTVAIHELPGSPTLTDVVDLVLENDFPMNEVGGMLKGSPELLLHQASTLAEERSFEFSGGEIRRVPSCYYEFAQRFSDAAGQLYLGFVAASANDIFESTTARNAGAGAFADSQERKDMS